MNKPPLQFNSLSGGIEGATRYVTGQPSQAQSLILGYLRDYLPFSSVVDIGCGGGSWMRAALDLGATRVRGFDLVPVPDDFLAVDRELITITDLGQRLELDERFDLAVSTEVAEHMEASEADTFVTNLTSISDIILFSAALPYQGGIHHVNEHWVEWWNRKFVVRDFVCFDMFRSVFWNDARIPYFYRQNCLLFVRRRWVPAMQAKGLAPTPDPHSLVHPELLLQAVNRARSSIDQHFVRDAAILYRVAIAGEETSEAEGHAYGREKLW